MFWHSAKSLKLAAVALAAVALSPLHATEILLDYSNVAGSYIVFDGHSHFSFTTGTNDFKVTSGGPALGLLGSIAGTFTIGNVTTIAGVSTAPVTGTGTLTIKDGFGFSLTGSLGWRDILQIGTGDFLNTSGEINLTGITYAGLNPALQQIASAPGAATDVLSFQFTPAKSLAKLKTTAAKTSFSGSIYRAPEGGSVVALLGLGLCAVAFLRQRRRV